MDYRDRKRCGWTTVSGNADYGVKCRCPCLLIAYSPSAGSCVFVCRIGKERAGADARAEVAVGQA
jgi:hypothetical protein